MDHFRRMCRLMGLGCLLESLLFLFLGMPLFSGPALGASLEPVTMQLKWHNQFQFAGFYAAKEKGFYQEAGLDVTLLPYEAEMDFIQAVLDGRADFGVAGPDILLRRMQGQPLVAVAAVMQHSPNVIMARADSGIATPHDLIGKRVMLPKKGGVDLWAMLRDEGVDEDSITLPPLTWDPEELVDGRIDATAAYLTNTPFLMQQRGIPVTLISPRTYGVDFYGDTIFTSERMLRKRPEAVAAFRAASLRGWEYALRHPGEIIRLILEKYPTEKSQDHLEYEAANLQQLIMPDIVPLGHMNPGRWQFMAETVAALGLAQPTKDLGAFVYDPGEGNPWLWWTFVILGSAVVVVATLAGWLFFFNARLKAAVRKRTLELSSLNLELTREIGVRHKVEQALRESGETIRAMSNASLDPVIMIDGWGRISFWSQAAERVFGYTETEAMGREVHELIAQERDRTAAVRGLERFSATGRGMVVGKTSEFQARRKDGSIFPMEISVAALHYGGQWCAVASIRDITARKLAEEQLRQMAITDSLTRTSNRRYFMELAARELERSRRYDRPFSLIMFDIDLFKAVNDTHGHDTGDLVLVTFVEQARLELRQNDLLARFGGEEFVALLPETDLEGAGRVAERVRGRMEALPIRNGSGTEVRITVSAGVVAYANATQNLQSLLKLADTALYKAKERGRNRVELLRAG